MSEVTGKAFDRKLLFRILSYAKPYKGYFMLTAFITITLSVMAPLRTYLIKVAIDDHVQIGNVEGLQALIILLVCLLVIHAVLQFFQSYSANWLGQTIVLDMRKQLFKHVMAFKLKYFDNSPIGALVTRVTSDIQTITDVFSQGLLTIISDILQLLVALLVMFLINYRLALIALIPVPILIVSTIVFKNVIKKAFQEVRKNVSKINTFVQEHVTGMNIVQIFNREKEEMSRFKDVNKAHMKGWLKTVWANAFFFPIVEVLSACSLGLLIWWWSKDYISGIAQQGDIIAFTLFVHMLYRPIRQLADRFNTLQMGMVAANRIFKILDNDEVIQDKGTISDGDVKGKIVFSDVTFSYVEGEPVLRNISFQVNPGNTLALVGATGAGKSSVINVLTRFYEIDQGDILIDGTNIKDFSLEYLRKVTSVVLQDVFLFDDTIHNNVTLNRAVEREEVIAASKEIGAHDFIMKLPGDYDFIVKERGVMLSAGQRQLLAFLRAYIYNPSILILDEATSSIDTESEIVIQKALNKLTEGRTSIVIAHRLSTIQNASKILVLEKGEIVESGSHEELMNLNGNFKKLYDYQFNK